MKSAGGALFRHDRRSVTSSVLTWTACWNVARLGGAERGICSIPLQLKNAQTRKRICSDIQVIPHLRTFLFLRLLFNSRQLQPESNFAGQRLKTAQMISVLLLLASLTCNCSPRPPTDRLTQSCCLGCEPAQISTQNWNPKVSSWDFFFTCIVNKQSRYPKWFWSRDRPCELRALSPTGWAAGVRSQFTIKSRDVEMDSCQLNVSPVQWFPSLHPDQVHSKTIH